MQQSGRTKDAVAKEKGGNMPSTVSAGERVACGDAQEALQALECIVAVEKAFRTETTSASTTVASSSLLDSAVLAKAGLTKKHPLWKVVTAQLQGMEVPLVQYGTVLSQADIAQRAQAVFEERLEGFLHDATKAGEVYAVLAQTAGTRAGRDELVAYVQGLLEKIAQTYAATVLCAKAQPQRARKMRKQHAVAAIAKCFLMEACCVASEESQTLVKRFTNVLPEGDIHAVECLIEATQADAVYRGVVEEAKQTARTLHETLQAAMGILQEHRLHIEPEILQQVELRLRSELAQELRVQRMVDMLEEQQMLRTCCEHLVQGQRGDALSVLRYSPAFDAQKHRALFAVLESAAWKTDAPAFFEALEEGVKCCLRSQPALVMPSKHLSPADALLLLRLFDAVHTDAIIEAQVLVAVACDAVGAFSPRSKTRQQVKRTSLFGDDVPERELSYMRYLVEHVLALRNNHDEVMAFLLGMRQKISKVA